MNDRELLEAAARAAGLNDHRFCEAWKTMNHYTPQDGYFGPGWNPLTDDGDALRLAVGLRFTVRAGYVKTPDHGSFDEGLLRIRQDVNAATRRAIVRAAAALATSARVPQATP